MPSSDQGLHLALSSEQDMIVRTMRAFVERELYPHEDEVERLRTVPKEIAEDIKRKAIAQGLFAPNFPTELGGRGLDAVTMVLVDPRNIAGLNWPTWRHNWRLANL